jgi:xylose dehydrogenase (NAD/NADP)
MKSNEVRWGILGSAKITEVEVGPAMLKTSRSRVVAVGSRNLERARKLADLLGADCAYGSYAELLADPNVDAVYVPLPNTMHAEWTIAALKAGKHVLCEKPMGMSSAEVNEMVTAARKADRMLMEGFMYRFHPRIARIRELLREGAIGDVKLVRATYTFDLGAASDVRSGGLDEDIRLNPDLGGGAVSDLGSYCVSGLRLYAGSRPKSVTSWKHSSPGRTVETMISGEIAFENGVIGQFFAALDIPGGGHIEILGTKGRIKMANAFRIRADQGPVTIEIYNLDKTTLETMPFKDQYELEIDHFVSAILDGVPSDIVSMDDSIDNALTLEAIRKSWTSGIVEVLAN